MSSFTTPLIVEVLDDGEFSVKESFEFHVGSYPGSDIIFIPAGSFTDFASTPWFMHWIFPKTGRYSKAAVVHDYLYRTGSRPRKDADAIFLNGMEVLGVPKWKRFAMYYAVRIFGCFAYQKNHNKTVYN